MNSLLQKRFAELADQATQVKGTRRSHMTGLGPIVDELDYPRLLKWTVSAKNLISKVCGEDSPHMKHFVEAEGGYASQLDQLRRMEAVLDAAREDFEGGYLTSLHDLVRAEVFDSELEQASELLRAGYGTAAAVIAGTVLETHLRALCSRNGIPEGKLDKMNADLAKAGIYNTIVQMRVTHLAAIRNSAAHGNQAEFQTYDVSSMISEIEQFLSNNP